MLKYAILILLVFVVGCKTIPQFPVVFFWSYNDLLKQEREIDKSFKKENN